MSDSDYAATLAHLYGLRRFGMRPGLEVVRSLLEAMGSPQSAAPVVLVAGSKGKGSVSVFASEALSAHGLKVGLFTKPHLQSYRERIRVGGETITSEAVVAEIEEVRLTAERLERAGRIDRSPTFFESTVALAFDEFRRQRVDVAIVEVGIGGRLDATNAADPIVSALTTVELEHTDVLGTTLTAIAEEKSGVLRPGRRLIRGALPEEARRVVDRHADALGAPVWRFGAELTHGERTLSPRGQTFDLGAPGVSVPRTRIALAGRFQAENAALALGVAAATLSHLDMRPAVPKLRRGFGAARWRGRLERLERSPDLIADVAHTRDSAHAVAESLGELYPLADPEGNAIVFGCLSDKPAAEMLGSLSRLAKTVVVVPVRSSRGARLDELSRAAHGRFPCVVRAPTLRDGLPLARAATDRDGYTLVVGSDYLVGELLDLLEGRDSAEPDLSDPGLAQPPAAGGAVR